MQRFETTWCKNKNHEWKIGGYTVDKNYYQDEEFEEFEEEQGIYFEDDILAEEVSFEEEEKSSGLKKMMVLMVALTIVICVISYGFRTEEVRVIGNKNYTSDEIKELIGFPEDGANTLFCYVRYLRYKVDDIPFLEQIKVKMESSSVICIEVDETNILACIRDGKKYYYFDDNGIVKEVLTEQRDTLPVIEGVDAEVLELDETISIENRTIYKGMMELSQLLWDYDIKAQKIEIDSEGRFTVYVNEKIRIGFGVPVWLEEKMIEAANILPEIEKIGETEDIQGILHLENYDSTKNSIVFTKENSN